MEAAEVLSGIFLLMIGILAVAPFPGNGLFYQDFPEFAAISLICGSVIIILGFYLTVVGLRSEKRSNRLDTIGVFFLLLSFLTLLTASITEDGPRAWIFVMIGVGFLSAGVGAVLIGKRRKPHMLEEVQKIRSLRSH
jgi:hypothetical protein